MRTLDLAIISPHQKFCERAKDLSTSFQFEFHVFRSDEDFFTEAENFNGITSVVLDCSYLEKPNEVAGLVQVARQGAPESYILTVISSKLAPEDARIAKTSGASLVMMESEYYSSCKAEFALSQVIRSAFIPVKTLDLIEDSELSFALYHLLPMNRRFLKVLKPDSKLSKAFLEKYSPAGDLFIPRKDLGAWFEYTNSFRAEDEAGLLRQCRSKFLQLNQSFLDLTLLISDQSSGASFAAGKEVYELCRKFSYELHSSLINTPDPWKVVASSAVGDFGSVERSPAISAYAGILSSQNQIGLGEEVMIGALLADIGYLEFSPSTARKVRNNQMSQLNAEELMEYHKHPIFSLNNCLSRRLPLTEAIKDMILMSHERSDQKGFPHRPRSDKLTEESMLVRLCWELDNRTQVRMGEKRPDIDEVKKSLGSALSADSGNFSVGFACKIAKILNTSDRGTVSA